MTNTKKWTDISVVKQDDFRIFSIDTTCKTSFRTGIVQDFFTINSSNWLNIIAVTPQKEVVMIEQYRHGSDKIELEIPGGIIEKSETIASQAALRELKEETGYTGASAIEIGVVNPNPALFKNSCRTFLVLNAIQSGAQELEQTEDIVVKLVPANEIQDLIMSGKISHGLVVAAFYFYDKFTSKNI